MKDRTFGVEFEFHFDRAHDGWRDQTRIAYDLLRGNGFGHWCHDIHHDGSGVEVPSPVLQGKDGLKELAEVTQLLRENGGVCNNADGLHVHHGADEFLNNKPLLYRLLKSWVDNHRHHEAFVSPDRRPGGGRAHEWCMVPRVPVFGQPECTRRCCEEGYYDDEDYDDRYYSLNVQPLDRYGTVEIRLHEGTLDYDKIEAWVLYGQQFIESVLRRKRPIRCADHTEQLLDRIALPKKAKTKLLEVAA